MVVSTPPVLTCGQWAASSQRCARVSRFSLVTLRSTRSSRSSGKISPDFILTCLVIAANCLRRILGTPAEAEWPGVTSFPDFKPSFPKWNRTDIATIVPGLDDNGLDLLDALLVYDPAGRISAKQACQHPYFTESNGSYLPSMKNGYH